MNRQYPPIGTISEGTMLPEHLIPAFLDVLQQYAPERYADVYSRFNPCIDVLRETGGSDYGEWPDTPHAVHLPDTPIREWIEHDLGYCLDALFDELAAIAPPYCYFGASKGDGADYGFWPALDSLEDDARYQDGVIKVNDLAEVPMLWDKLVMLVNDHGNVTLYQHCALNDNMTEIWSIV